MEELTQNEKDIRIHDDLIVGIKSEINEIHKNTDIIKGTLIDHEVVHKQIWDDIKAIQSITKSGTASFLLDLKKTFEDLDICRRNILALELKSSNLSKQIDVFKLDVENEILNAIDSETGKPVYSNVEKRSNAIKSKLGTNTEYISAIKENQELIYKIKDLELEEKRLKDSSRWLILTVEANNHD